MEGDVSFVLKDTPVDPDHKILGGSYLLSLTQSCYLFTESINASSIRTSSSRCWIYMSCRLERSICLSIKISLLEEVSLLLHVIYSTRCS